MWNILLGKPLGFICKDCKILEARIKKREREPIYYKRLRWSNRMQCGDCIYILSQITQQPNVFRALWGVSFAVPSEQWDVFVCHTNGSVVALLLRTQQLEKVKPRLATSTPASGSAPVWPPLVILQGRGQWSDTHKESTGSPLGHQRSPGNGQDNCYYHLGCSVLKRHPEDTAGFSSENHKPAAWEVKGCKWCH